MKFICGSSDLRSSGRQKRCLASRRNSIFDFCEFFSFEANERSNCIFIVLHLCPVALYLRNDGLKNSTQIPTQEFIIHLACLRYQYGVIIKPVQRCSIWSKTRLKYQKLKYPSCVVRICAHRFVYIGGTGSAITAVVPVVVACSTAASATSSPSAE